MRCHLLCWLGPAAGTVAACRLKSSTTRTVSQILLSARLQSIVRTHALTWCLRILAASMMWSSAVSDLWAQDTTRNARADSLQRAASKDSVFRSQRAGNIGLAASAADLSTDAEKAKVDAGKAKDDSQKAKAVADLTRKQAEAIRLTGGFARAYATGAAARTAILQNLAFGLRFGTLSSPFASPTFERRYVRNVNYLRNALALTSVVAAFALTKDANTRLAILGGGVSASALTDLVGQSDQRSIKQASKVVNELNANIDLFDFNRTVYTDILRLNGRIASASATDSQLPAQLKRFVDDANNQRLLLKDSKDMAGDPLFCSYISNAEALFVRLEPLVSQVTVLYNEAEGMLKGYHHHTLFTPNGKAPSNPYAKEIDEALSDLEKGLKDSQENWATLQAFLVLSPSDRQRLSAFGELQAIKQSLGGFGCDDP